jgi:hypothetical protein
MPLAGLGSAGCFRWKDFEFWVIDWHSTISQSNMAFTTAAFDPVAWKPNYPNPAFVEMTPLDLLAAERHHTPGSPIARGNRDPIG